MTRQKQLRARDQTELDKNIFTCMNNFVHNMIACEQAILGVTQGYDCLKSDHQSKNSSCTCDWKIQEILLK